MDFPNPRRTGATYGKANKKVLVHDFFDYRHSPEALANVETNVVDVKSTSKQVKPATHLTFLSNRDTQINSSVRSSPSLSTVSDTPSPRPDPQNASSRAVNVFDISSSEDESKRAEGSKETTKRRKLARPIRGNVTESDLQGTKTVAPPRQNTNGVNVSNGHAINSHPHTTHSKRKEGKDTKNVIRGSKGSSRHQGTHKSRPIEVYSAQVQDSYNRGNDMKKQRLRSADDAANVDSSGHLTDQSTKSTSGTPKRKRPQSQYSDESVPSPSSIGFTALKLTPERKLLPNRMASPSMTSDEDETPRKPRSRLIDRLDAPQQSPNILDHGASTSVSPQKPSTAMEPRTTSINVQTTDLHTVDGTVQGSQPKAEQPQVPRVRATYGTKARTTYAKERSHLSDMAEDLDLLGDGTGTNPSQYLSSQRTASNLAMQLELDDDDDEGQSGPSKIKSIHELRKAGANNRFDREVQGILEDIENEGGSNKALRLQALMKLIRRTDEDSTFLRHLLDTGKWQRLVKAASGPLDVLSATLFGMAFLLLSSAASAGNAPKIFDIASRLATQLLQIDEPLHMIAAERKSNLSKSLQRELLEFGDFILQHSLRDMIKDSSMRPSIIALVLLQQSLRKCVEPGIAVGTISKECVLELLNGLVRHTQKLADDSDSELAIIRIEKTFEVLEAFSIASDDLDAILAQGKHEDLGVAVASIMAWAREHSQPFNKRVLQAVVNLSNSKPHVCHLLARTGSIKAIFAIINDHFQTVATQADHEQAVDENTLDLVILALVCLLNFAECDSDARVLISSDNQPEQNYTAQLVAIFNSQASKVQEATTQEQSQVLVAVGYLSMVLCTMALDLTIRTQITTLLHGKSFGELCRAAETFFQHLCTLEEMSGEDGTMGTFIARFNTILETVKGSDI